MPQFPQTASAEFPAATLSQGHQYDSIRHSRDIKMGVSCSHDEALGPDGAANNREQVQLNPTGTAQPLTLSRNEEVCPDSAEPAATELTAEFEKHFPGGPVIQ